MSLKIIDENGLIHMRDIESEDELREWINNYHKALDIFAKYYLGQTHIDNYQEIINRIQEDILKRAKVIRSDKPYWYLDDIEHETLKDSYYYLEIVERELKILENSLARFLSFDCMRLEKERRARIEQRTNDDVISLFDKALTYMVESAAGEEKTASFGEEALPYKKLSYEKKAVIIKKIIEEFVSLTNEAKRNQENETCKQDGHKFSEPKTVRRVYFKFYDPTDVLDQRGKFVNEVYECQECSVCGLKKEQLLRTESLETYDFDRNSRHVLEYAQKYLTGTIRTREEI